MSLKTFHICFIALSTSLAFGFGVWAFQNLEPQSGLRLVFGVGGFLAAGGLLGYGSWFVRKMRDSKQP
jgi:hypothetical protein